MIGSKNLVIGNRNSIQGSKNYVLTSDFNNLNNKQNVPLKNTLIGNQWTALLDRKE